MRMAEKEQEHRHTIEHAALEEEKTAIERGQWLGSILSFLCVGASAYTAVTGAPWQVSVALVSIPVMGVIRSLIERRHPPQI